MKKINRFKVFFGLWFALLTWCAFFSNNVYVNAFVLYFGFIALICSFAYVYKNMNEKEQKFTEKLANIF